MSVSLDQESQVLQNLLLLYPKLRNIEIYWSWSCRSPFFTSYEALLKNKKGSVWPNGWVFVYKLSGSGFESSCSYLNFRFGACFEQGVPWHSGNYTVWFTLKRVRDMRRTSLKLVSLFNFRDDFWRKMFFLLYSITWPHFSVCLLLLRKILSNMCNVISC